MTNLKHVLAIVGVIVALALASFSGEFSVVSSGSDAEVTSVDDAGWADSGTLGQALGLHW